MQVSSIIQRDGISMQSEEVTEPQDEELVLKIINEKLATEHIPAEWLCDGLCSVESFGKYCTRELDVDFLTLNAMLQRLGMDSSDFITWVDMETFEYLGWQNEVILCVRQKNPEGLRKLIGDSKTGDLGTLNERLVVQFDSLARGILAQLEGRNEAAVDYLDRAAKCTIAGYKSKENYIVFMSENEILILLILYSIRLENAKKAECRADMDDIGEELYRLMNYLHGGRCDVRQEAKLYPYVAYIYADIQMQLGTPERAIVPCQDAIALMRKHNFSRMLKLTLTIYIELMKCLGIEARAEGEKRLLAGWQEVLKLGRSWEGTEKEAGVDIIEVLYECIVDGNCSYEAMQELVKMYRMREGLTQKELSVETGYDMKSIWMIENAKQKPHKSGYRRIRSRLNIPAGYTHSDIYCTSYRAYQLKYRITRAMTDGDNITLEKSIDELEEELQRDTISRDNVFNRQYIMDCRNVLFYTTGRITAQQYLKRCQECLALTVNINNSKIMKGYLRQEELLIIIHMAWAYSDTGNNKAAIKKVRLVIDYCTENNNVRKYSNRFILALSNLAIYYGKIKKYSEAIDISKKGLLLDLCSGKGKKAISFIHSNAFSNAMIGNRKIAMEYFKVVADASDIFYNDEKELAIKNYTILIKGRDSSKE